MRRVLPESLEELYERYDSFMVKQEENPNVDEVVFVPGVVRNTYYLLLGVWFFQHALILADKKPIPPEALARIQCLLYFFDPHLLENARPVDPPEVEVNTDLEDVYEKVSIDSIKVSEGQITYMYKIMNRILEYKRRNPNKDALDYLEHKFCPKGEKDYFYEFDAFLHDVETLKFKKGSLVFKPSENNDYADLLRLFPKEFAEHVASLGENYEPIDEGNDLYLLMREINFADESEKMSEYLETYNHGRYSGKPWDSTSVPVPAATPAPEPSASAAAKSLKRSRTPTGLFYFMHNYGKMVTFSREFGNTDGMIQRAVTQFERSLGKKVLVVDQENIRQKTDEAFLEGNLYNQENGYTLVVVTTPTERVADDGPMGANRWNRTMVLGLNPLSDEQYVLIEDNDDYEQYDMILKSQTIEKFVKSLVDAHDLDKIAEDVEDRPYKRERVEDN